MGSKIVRCSLCTQRQKAVDSILGKQGCYAQPGQKPVQTGDAYHFIYWETNSGCLRRLIKPYLSMTSSTCSDRIININKQIGTFIHVHCFVNPALHLQGAGVTDFLGLRQDADKLKLPRHQHSSRKTTSLCGYH